MYCHATYALEKARELKGLVRRVDALMEMKQQEVNRLEVAEQIVMGDIKQHINSLSDRIDQLRQLIADHINNDPSLRQQKELLLSIPGIGEKTVAVLLSYFSSIHRFSHAKKLAAFCGVTPRVCDSGSSINKYRRLSKVGASDLRKVLFFPPWSLLDLTHQYIYFSNDCSLLVNPKWLLSEQP